MPKQDPQIQRKVEHLFLAEKFFTDESFANFDKIRLLHDALPELRLNDIDLTTDFLGTKVALPIYFNAITGGSRQSDRFNTELAQLAQKLNIPVSSGSMGVYFRLPEETKASFTTLRSNNPKGFVIANVSAKANAQQSQQAVNLIKANALQIHLNALQELAMPEGDQEFMWLDNIKDIVKNVSVPVIVKEVGFGISQINLRQLYQAGVRYVDISGFGGTNFAQIESARNHDLDLSYLDQLSLSTVESLLESRPYQNKMTILASGGIRTPMDVIKALRLGASSVGMSGLVLHHLQKSSLSETETFFEKFIQQLQLIMAAIGAKNINDIKKAPIVLDESLVNYIKQRNLKL
ncbi:isopentenyl-diphosphate delta-isomerase [Companilactobacillus crustorum]|uniref:Isopentenyl-diphosphate delta-isomerase n=3 Tax=Companilactobacillus TaxID=2767879 RepID=A0A837RLQ7_9LACO|nr:type 2 isopentenyl-diphosphate Delta-isomerase [Companilactobacillus crustorum]HCD08022.1 type 2 isopentenyl-diphosphate Delta-isomerase [Lactobacillus sp.]KRK43778.1 isopentenyl pyrophosphate isomerase [Companilactobacillus crustorum JCM 15951]KRO21166.1 isopentenyl pyrophosphate isomerase [Companilactobacillus crustorum]WDT66601.1 type 2 isopentenyl-diphosphate Delta-isomerase [Companilactobacillus crustorum]GEO76207.1 isopentenyl-diphosphate delta-isomerase [Companilactobacillus crustoru